ncbi:MAG: hypothetical protein HOI93_04780 [Rhodobacteraceae bacterium]|nr:hypothetical protein [Paracoccaceae bacterium]
MKGRSNTNAHRLYWTRYDGSSCNLKFDLSRAWNTLKIGVSDSWCMHHDAPSVFAGHYDSSFSIDLCQKDQRLIMLACDDA